MRWDEKYRRSIICVCDGGWEVRKGLLAIVSETMAAHFVKELVEFNHLWRANCELSHISTVLHQMRGQHWVTLFSLSSKDLPH